MSSVVRRSVVKPKLEQLYFKSDIVEVQSSCESFDWTGKQGFVLDYYVTYASEEYYIVWLHGYNQPITILGEHLDLVRRAVKHGQE